MWRWPTMLPCSATEDRTGTIVAFHSAEIAGPGAANGVEVSVHDSASGDTGSDSVALPDIRQSAGKTSGTLTLSCHRALQLYQRWNYKLGATGFASAAAGWPWPVLHGRRTRHPNLER